eukprot:COSAG01_NODE_2603_length_7393_cov_39.196874_6_plen_207_part_00
MVRARRFHLGIGPCWLRFTYITPVLIKKLRMQTARQVVGCDRPLLRLLLSLPDAAGGQAAGQAAPPPRPQSYQHRRRRHSGGHRYARRFQSWLSIVTEIYLCHTCSCHEILRMEHADRAGAAPAPRVWLFSFEVAATMWAHWGGVPCAVHCSELAGVFFSKPPSNASAEGRLVRTMVRHLLSFVASGDPNSKTTGTPGVSSLCCPY